MATIEALRSSRPRGAWGDNARALWARALLRLALVSCTLGLPGASLLASGCGPTAPQAHQDGSLPDSAAADGCAGDPCGDDGGGDDGGGTACGNAVVEPELGETCDDGNQVAGDGCDELCHLELLYPGMVRVQDGQVVVRDQPLFVIGAAGLPQGVSETEALAAGFNVLLGSGSGGYRLVPLLQSGADLPDFVLTHQDEANVLAWLGPDEPAWNGMSADEVRTEYADPLAAADPYGRPFVLNHAPRGTVAQPDNFSLLEPYLELTQLAAMDIYPIPTGNGHSNLPGHPGLDAVGAYTQILVNLVHAAGTDQAVLMVLLGAGLGHIPDEAWDNLETWQTDASLPASDVRFVVAGDFDADGVSELVVGEQGAGGAGTGHLVLYDFQEDTWGGRRQIVALPADLGLAGHLLATAGDFDGDGADDLMILVDQGTDRQDFWVAQGGTPGAGGITGLGTPVLALRSSEPDIVLQVVYHAVAGDVDGDGCDDLVLSYDYPGPDHQSWLVAPSGCIGFAQGFSIPASVWYDAPTASLDLERVDHAAAADTDGDGLQDLLITYRAPDGSQEILRLLSAGTGFSPPDVVMQDTATALDLLRVPFLFAGDVNGDAVPELVLGYSDPAGTNALRVGALIENAMPYDALALVPWMTKDSATLELGSLLGAAAGDLDGDGLVDVVMVHPDPASPAARLRIAFSTSRKFGARDPLGKELWFMALDAVARGAGGVIFWGQSFVNAGHVAWTRLTEVAQKLSALQAVFEETPLELAETGTFAWRWFAGPQGARLVVCHESSEPAEPLPAVPLPAGVTASSVDLWDGSSFVPHSTAAVGTSLTDSIAFGPYEARVYAVR